MDYSVSRDLATFSPAGMATATTSTGWHRKWLLLCAALVWLFFLRFRLMGWLLSQLLTLAMRWKLPPRLRAHAHIQYVTMRPLELGHIAIHCNSKHWRVVCSRIAITTFVLEFFRSFVQKKMLLVTIEDVYIDVFRVDDELLREFVRRQAATHGAHSTASASTSTTTSSSSGGGSSAGVARKKSNPMGFMRFIDFRVKNLHLQVDAFETRSRFRCCDLKVDIPDVFAAQDYLHLSVEASSVFLSSRRLETSVHSVINGDTATARAKESAEDGLSCELTNWSAVLDVRLSDQHVLGCKIEGDKDEPAYFFISTTFVEKLLLKKMELIRQELFPIPKELYQSQSHDSTPVITRVATSSPPFSLRVADMPMTIDLVHRPRGRDEVPLQISAHVSQLHYHKNCTPEQANKQTTGPSPKPGNGIQVSMDWRDIKIHDGQSETQREIALISRLQVKMNRDDEGHGSVDGTLDNVQLAVNPRLCEVLHSLVLFPDVVEEYEKAALQLMHEQVAIQCGHSTSPLKKKVAVQWRLHLDVDSWALRSWLGAMERGRTRDLEAHGQRTTVRSVLPPKSSGAAVQHVVELEEVQATISVLPPGVHPTRPRVDHAIHFVGVCIPTTKLISAATATKSMELKLSASSISLNDHMKGQTTRAAQLPGLFFSNMAFHLTEVETNGSIHVGYGITTAEADFATSHRQHKQILDELSSVASTLDKVRGMLTPPEPSGTVKVSDKLDSKALSVHVAASAIRVQLFDVDNVTDRVEFQLTESKLSHQKSITGVKNAATCTFLQVLWPESSRVVEVTGFRFDQVVEIPASSTGLLSSPEAETLARSDISMTQLRLWLQPDRRLLLLCLKLDELVNSKEESAAAKVKKPSTQIVNWTCVKMTIDVRDDPSCGVSSPLTNTIDFEQLAVHASIAKSYEITDAMQRYLQTTRRDESCHARLANCIQILSVDGAIQVESITVQSTELVMLSVHDLHHNFTISDVATTASPVDPPSYESVLLPKVLLFDASAVAKELRVKISPKSSACAKMILPILQQTLDTRDEAGTEISASSSSSTESAAPGEWRLRYVGAADFGIEHLVVTLPCETDVFQKDTGGAFLENSESSERFVQVHVDQLACNSRQFQKMAVQFDALRVVLTDRDLDDRCASGSVLRSVGDDPLPLPLLLLPCSKLDAVIHWRAASSSSVAAPPVVQQFAVSFDLVLRGRPASAITQVPVAGETLVVLNWDYVYPLLVFLLTDDDNQDDESTKAKPSPQSPTFQCIGVQWNLSLDVLQLAWWDSLSQDAGILIVTNDLLSHGIARFHTDGEGSPSHWILWETTIYLDLFRAYLLREAHVEDGFIPLSCGALPFEPMPSSRFFVETTGTSYRASHSSSSSDELTNDMTSGGPLFGDLGFAIADKIHSQFTRVHYAFCIGTASRLHRLNSSSSSSDPTYTSGGSPPKSPRAWTQSVRAKLARLKRRTSSMDNMLLNDGSRPIQVDSMKLLWTIETRDCAFYMIAVVSDSLEAILEAGQPTQGVPVRPIHSTDSGKSQSSPHAGFTKPTVNVTVVDSGQMDAARTGRRGSTRESLLDLLHQGKLGKKDSIPGESGSFHSSSSSMNSDTKSSRSDSEELHPPRAIKHKKYTLDVHDAQINMLEDGSRSSALIASKHIHFEIGFDETSTMTIATLKFDCVTGHVAPVDVDISAGVLWYSYTTRGSTSSPGSPSPRSSGTSSPMLLKQVVDECSLNTTYTQVLASGATTVEADMSSLQISTDRHQFYQLLNVLRHVLLAPPTVIRRTIKRTTASRRETPIESNSTLAVDDIAVFPATPTHSVSAQSSKKLHAQLVEELRHRDAKMLGTYRSTPVVFKHISFRSAGCVFRLRTSPESTGGDHEFVEIRAEGITGSHMFFLSQSTKFVLNLQWLEINNLRPGPSSIAFDDAMAVLKAKLMVNPRFQSGNLTTQKGMLTVRAESGPQMRVLGQKLRVLEVLEVSIFPEIPNMIVIQLAADFYELVYKFFFEAIHHHANEHQDVGHSEHGLFGKKGSTSSMVGPSMSSSIGFSSTTSTLAPQSPMTKSRAYIHGAAPSSPPHPLTIRRKSIQMSTATSAVVTSESVLSASTLSTSPVSSTSVSPSGEVTTDEDDSSADGHELFYFKYVRIGNVRLRINCNGFFVNLTHFDLDLPPYVCQSKLCTWKKLLQKFESHLKWHVTKESASTGLSHFKNKLLKWTPSGSSSSSSSSASEKRDKLHQQQSQSQQQQQHKREEDNATTNAQVLFGPYSGTH